MSPQMINVSANPAALGFMIIAADIQVRYSRSLQEAEPHFLRGCELLSILITAMNPTGNSEDLEIEEAE